MDDADDVDGVDASGMSDRGHGRGFSLSARFPAVHCWLTVPWGCKRGLLVLELPCPSTLGSARLLWGLIEIRLSRLAPGTGGRVPAAGVSAFQSAPVERDLLKTC